MTYLLIAIMLTIILSPLLSMRSSNRLKEQEVMRRLAGAEGIRVHISRRVDARDDEKDLDAICYRIGWGQNTPSENSGAKRGWTLVQNGLRGMEAQWPNWRWFEGPAPASVSELLNMVVPELPVGVDGVKVDQAGVAIFWNERGTENDARSIVTALKILRDQLLLLDGK
jgi:hypothetical protein